MSDGNFPNGLIVKKPHQNAPGFVKCKLSFSVNDFIQCLQQNNMNGWVNMDVKLSQKGTLYAEIDNWQPNQQPQQQPQYQQQPQNQVHQQRPIYQQPAPPQQQYQAPQQQPMQDYQQPPFDPDQDVPF